MSEIDFTRLRLTLLQGGVAPRFVRRTIRELGDHLEELQHQEANRGLTPIEAERSAHALLGDEEKIAAEVLSRREMQSLSRRFPRTVYGIGPVLVYIIAALSITFAYLVPAFTVFELSVYEPWPAWYFWLAQLAAWFSEFLVTPIIAVGFCLLAIRRAVPMFWPLVGVGVVVFFGSGWDTLIEMPDAGRGGISFQWGYQFIPWRPVQVGWPQTLEKLVRIALTSGMIHLLLKHYRPYRVMN